MAYRKPDDDAAVALLERQWFAAFKAASGARERCEALLEEMAATERAWNEARARLTEFERLRDALGQELARLQEDCVTGMCAAGRATAFADVAAAG
jgi:chromosome segregation ATPase